MIDDDDIPWSEDEAEWLQRDATKKKSRFRSMEQQWGIGLRVHRLEQKLLEAAHVPRDGSVTEGPGYRVFDDCSSDCPTCEAIRRLHRRKLRIAAKIGPVWTWGWSGTAKDDRRHSESIRSKNKMKRQLVLRDLIDRSIYSDEEIEQSRDARNAIYDAYSTWFRVSRKTFMRDLHALGFKLT